MVRIDKIDDGDLIPVVELNRSDSRTPGKRFSRYAGPPGFHPGRRIVGSIRDLGYLPRCTTQGMAGRCCALRDRNMEAAMEGIGRCQGNWRQAIAGQGGSRDGIPHGSAVPERRDTCMWGDPGTRPLLPCVGWQTRASSAGSSRSTGRFSCSRPSGNIRLGGSWSRGW